MIHFHLSLSGKYLLLFCLMVCGFTFLSAQSSSCGFNGKETVKSTQAQDKMLTTCGSGVRNNQVFDQNYVPAADDEIMTINLRLIVLQRSTGDPQNFTENDLGIIDDIMGHANATLSDPAPPIVNTIVNPQGFPTIEDTRIRLNVPNGPEFIIDEELYDSYVCSTAIYDKYKDATDDCTLTLIFLGGSPGNGGCGMAYYGEHRNFMTASSWNLQTNPNINSWGAGRNIVHELGHCLGMLHTQSYNNPASFPFPDVVYPVDGTWCSPGNNTDPNVVCSNNFMAYSISQTNISPAQAGHMREMLYHSWRSKWLDLEQTTMADLRILSGTQEVWDRAQTLDRDLIVENGATLTIACRLIIAAGADIIVEPGGHLIVDGGELTTKTNSCGGREYWAGIDALGNPAASQSTQNQAFVEVINGGTIAYARNGVSTGRNGNGNSAGAIVQCQDAVFLNNQRHLEYLEYMQDDNLSFFSDCTFLNNLDFDHSGANFHAVTIYKNYGIDFIDCRFDWQATDGGEERGILSLNAGFNFNGADASVTGYRTGIHVGPTAGNIVRIQDALFLNNSVGVRTSNAHFFKIDNCTFEIGSNPFPTVPSPLNAPILNHGIITEFSSRYLIRENTFVGLPSFRETYGALIYESGEEANRLNLNTFSDLIVGSQAEGLNRSISIADQGLSYRCNELSNNEYGVLAQLSLEDMNEPDPIGGIALSQGTNYSAAGNTFSTNQTDLFNAYDPIIEYWVNDDDPGTIPLTFSGFSLSESESATCKLGGRGHPANDKTLQQVPKALNANRPGVVALADQVMIALAEGNTKLASQYLTDFTTKNVPTAEDKEAIDRLSGLIRLFETKPDFGSAASTGGQLAKLSKGNNAGTMIAENFSSFFFGTSLSFSSNQVRSGKGDQLANNKKQSEPAFVNPTIFPNPVAKNLQIHAPGQIVTSLRVIDLNGQQVLSKSGKDLRVLNVEDLRKGLYLLQITFKEGEHQVLKFYLK